MASSQSTEKNVGLNFFVSIVLALWFVLVYFLGSRAAFIRPPETPPLPILMSFSFPLFVFFAGYLGFASFRKMVLTADLRLLTAIQAWRAGGLGFLALYAHGVLPALFALPAGLGDIAIGVTAPWMALALVRGSAFKTSLRFVVWNLLGILDLVVAVSLGALGGGLIPGLVEVTTAPMAQLPLVLIPAYFVPLFIMFHLAALFQARHLAASRLSGN